MVTPDAISIAPEGVLSGVALGTTMTLARGLAVGVSPGSGVGGVDGALEWPGPDVASGTTKTLPGCEVVPSDCTRSCSPCGDIVTPVGVPPRSIVREAPSPSGSQPFRDWGQTSSTSEMTSSQRPSATGRTKPTSPAAVSASAVGCGGGATCVCPTATWDEPGGTTVGTTRGMTPSATTTRTTSAAAATPNGAPPHTGR